MLRGFGITTILVLVIILTHTAHADPPQFLPGESVGTVAFAEINEASGMVASRKNPNVFWVHNDSGDGPYVYALHWLAPYCRGVRRNYDMKIRFLNVARRLWMQVQRAGGIRDAACLYA